MKLLAASLLTLAMPMVAQAEIIVTDPWARASVLASRPGAAYLTLTSSEADRLLQVTSPAAGHVMLHGVETNAAGVSRMVHIQGLDISPGTPVTLAPGNSHLMLIDLSRKLEKGETFLLTLVFEFAGKLTVAVPVLGPGAMGPTEKRP